MADSNPTKVPSIMGGQDGRSVRFDDEQSGGSSSMFNNMFDTSQIFSKKTSVSSQDDTSVAGAAAVSASALAVPSSTKTRSKSLAGLGIPSEAEYRKLLDLSGRKDVPAGASLKPKADLAPPAGNSRRRISVAVMESRPGGGPLAGISAPRSATDDDVGSLSKMFRSAFGSTSPKKAPTLGYLPEEEEPSTASKMHKPDFSSLKSEDTGGSPELVPVTITPEPRRLFGFGPQYTPPAETVMVPADEARKLSSGATMAGAGGSLVDKVKLAGITGGFTAIDTSEPAGRRKFGSILKAPTGEEMNTWAPFST